MNGRTTRITRGSWGAYPNAASAATVANAGYTMNELPHCVRAIYLGPRDTTGLVLMKMPMFSDFIPITPDCPWVGEVRGPIYFMPAYVAADNVVVIGDLFPTLDLIFNESPLQFPPRRAPVIYRSSATVNPSGGWVLNRKSVAAAITNTTVGNVVITYYNEIWREGTTQLATAVPVGSETIATGVTVYRSILDATAMRTTTPGTLHRFYISPDVFPLTAGSIVVVAND